MFILARRVGESLHIGEDITITVVAKSKSIVKLGIQAPREISVLRDEQINPALTISEIQDLSVSIHERKKQ